jgi:hypothetical protein
MPIYVTAKHRNYTNETFTSKLPQDGIVDAQNCQQHENQDTKTDGTASTPLVDSSRCNMMSKQHSNETPIDVHEATRNAKVSSQLFNSTATN